MVTMRPPQQGQRFVVCGSGSVALGDGTFSRSDFKFDKEGNVYVCPAGNAWPLAARAQQPGERIRRIGVLQDTAEDDPQRKRQFARFRDGLASFGWLEGPAGIKAE
jgi:hypothetical protein